MFANTAARLVAFTFIGGGAALFVVAVATEHWLQTSSGGFIITGSSEANLGLWRICRTSTITVGIVTSQSTSCSDISVDDKCTFSFGDSKPISSCTDYNVTRGTVLGATLLAGMAALIVLLAIVSSSKILTSLALGFALLSVACGAVATAFWVTFSKGSDWDGWSFDYSFDLATAAWPAVFVGSIVLSFAADKSDACC